MNNKIIRVEQLLAGTYVTRIVAQTGRVEVRKTGWIRTDAAVARLLEMGITQVEIDPDRQLDEAVDAVVVDADVASGQPLRVDDVPKVAFDDEVLKASRLYAEARSYQALALEKIKAGKPIDLEPCQEIINAFIDSVFRNQDALSCMTRIRQKDQYLLEHSMNVSTWNHQLNYESLRTPLARLENLKIRNSCS